MAIDVGKNASHPTTGSGGGVQRGSLSRLVTRTCALLALAGLNAGLAPPAAWAQDAGSAVSLAIASPKRSAKFVARDKARHPLQELEFFGLQPSQHVVEIWPGGGYWTEILAPVLHDRGVYDLVLQPPKPGAPPPALLGKLKADPAIYGKAIVSEAGKGVTMVAPPGSADLVLTFRNLHNWMAGGYAPQMLAAFYTALKPGGVLGIEEHRGNRDGVQDPKAEDGYVRQDYATQMIEQAGFTLVGSSELDANPKDTANWPGGVWTLPPELTLGARDRNRYLAIGEADNFIMKFRKPMR